MFKNTTATKKIFSLNKRIRAVSGGTAASKTISILIWLIDYGQSSSNEVLTVVAESFPHLQLGAIRDFKNIMLAHGYWDDSRWNEAKHIYKFNQGTTLEFISFDKFGKAHGPRRDVLFLNEANNIPHPIADQLITRTRKIVWMDWNPTNEFWFYTEMLNTRKDIDFITLNYLDNEAVDETTKAEIESHKHNKNWWTVYGLGELGVIETRIYKDWEFLDDVPRFARLERRGLDFGYSNDPSALVAVYFYDGGYVLDEELFQKRMSNKQIADTILNQQEPQTLVIADSAEPKSIDELKAAGINVVGSEKGKDSVNNGIQIVQAQKIAVTKRSVNIIKEYRNYLWDTDRDGKILNVPQHEFSHSMDATRYALASIIKKPIVINQASSPVLPYYPELGI